MGTSSQSFVCAECGTGMERVEGAPVLQSLAGHAVHRCAACGHILLVQEKAGRSPLPVAAPRILTRGMAASWDCKIGIWGDYRDES